MIYIDRYAQYIHVYRVPKKAAVHPTSPGRACCLASKLTCLIPKVAQMWVSTMWGPQNSSVGKKSIITIFMEAITIWLVVDLPL